MFEEGTRVAGIACIVGTKAMVDVPIIRMDVASEMGMEEMVMAGAPGVSVIPFGRTTLAPGDGSVKLCPATA